MAIAIRLPPRPGTTASSVKKSSRSSKAFPDISTVPRGEACARLQGKQQCGCTGPGHCQPPRDMTVLLALGALGEIAAGGIGPRVIRQLGSWRSLLLAGLAVAATQARLGARERP